MIDYKHAIEVELFLSLYADWQVGMYKSSRGLVRISEMNDVHLQNALNDLKRKREIRAELVSKLTGGTDHHGTWVDLAQSTYQNEEDLLALKITELEEELESR